MLDGPTGLAAVLIAAALYRGINFVLVLAVLIATNPGKPARNAVGTASDQLMLLGAIWIDAGNRDEHYLDLGATAFRKAVAAAGVPDDRVYFELFDAGHAAIEYRYPLSLAWLCKRLA